MPLPPVSTIVLAVEADPRLVRAVRSLVSQDAAGEIIVVNSGGGNAQQLLDQAGLKDVIVLQSEALLFPGAARNAGLKLAKAPYIAFLACDCVAPPGWLSARLRHHAAGHDMVASAVMPLHQRNLVSWAYHLLMFPQRLPHLPATRAIRYGVSFARSIFEAHGQFDESLRSGEDSELLRRIAALPPPLWTPDVVTLHDNPTELKCFWQTSLNGGTGLGWKCAASTAVIRGILRDFINAMRFMGGAPLSKACAGLAGYGRLRLGRFCFGRRAAALRALKA